jgi:hypothetical protein
MAHDIRQRFVQADFQAPRLGRRDMVRGAEAVQRGTGLFHAARGGRHANDRGVVHLVRVRRRMIAPSEKREEKVI